MRTNRRLRRVWRNYSSRAWIIDMTAVPTPDRPAERVLTRTCPHCGGTFTPARPHQKHCRPSCRLAAFKGRRAQSGVPDVSSDGDRLAGLFE
jgi:hypothetical protein